jgi:hypothetical protein
MGLADVALSEVADGKLTSESTASPLLATAEPAVISFPAAATSKKKAA